MKPRFWTLVGIVTLAAMARIMPHPWNVTPVAAMALFGGAHFHGRTMAFSIPILAMIASDMVLGFHALAPLVYASFALTVVIGFWIQRQITLERIVLGSFAASVLFFVITNLGVWSLGGLYPKTSQGLLACFVAALPYYRLTAIGDLAYSALFFGGFYLA
jgi:hypothetical protein